MQGFWETFGEQRSGVELPLSTPSDRYLGREHFKSVLAPSVADSPSPSLRRAIGPIAGGWIAERLPGDGYKWVFFSTTIVSSFSSRHTCAFILTPLPPKFCALVQIMGIIFLKETYSPTLLHRQALALKKEMGLDPKSDKVQTIYELKSANKTVGHHIRHGMIRPFVMFSVERKSARCPASLLNPPEQRSFPNRYHSGPSRVHGLHVSSSFEPFSHSSRPTS